MYDQLLVAEETPANSVAGDGPHRQATVLPAGLNLVGDWLYQDVMKSMMTPDVVHPAGEGA